MIESQTLLFGLGLFPILTTSLYVLMIKVIHYLLNRNISYRKSRVGIYSNTIPYIK